MIVVNSSNIKGENRQTNNAGEAYHPNQPGNAVERRKARGRLQRMMHDAIQTTA